ncbi:MAG: 3-isopropylmalate dehydratase small subunit [Sphingomonas sp. 28-62-20]|uniref:3-isopropylmalate dehydratase small subunit n=1 Tax=Sphingomonas sp. 28-62-20 TaxID=1970433 RepID=UPI000BD6DE51|nr:MAG: 3-isopropylmalate dehydratase small subunit [Sphingomonas sp. 28-62-20]
MTASPPVPHVSGIAAPLIRANIDTDAIIPSREIKGVGKTGLADGLFAGWRYLEGRTPDPDFILNQPRYAHAPILLGGDNFGCGSSREHAVWALHDYGMRAVIAPSYAPIFQSNCVRNGIIPVVLDAGLIAQLGDMVAIDLLAQTVTSNAVTAPFEIDAEAKAMLAEGLDAIDLTLKHRAAIDAFLIADQAARPWIYLEPSA